MTWLPTIPDTIPAPFRRRIVSFQYHLEGGAVGSPRTVGTYLEGIILFGRFLATDGHSGDLATITAEHCRRFLAALAVQPHRVTGRPLSATTVNNRGRALQAFWGWAAAEWEIPNPMTNVAIPKPANVTIPIAPDADLRLLLAAAAGRDFAARRDSAFLWFLIASGARLAEAAGLQLADLDLRQRRARVQGKGRKPRDCMFSAKAVKALDRYIDVRSDHPHAGRPALWLGREGPLTVSGCYQIVHERAAAAAAACADPVQAARLRSIGPHDLRHAAAARYLRAGGQSDNLNTHFGWDSPNMAAYYVKAVRGDLAAAEYRRLGMGEDL